MDDPNITMEEYIRLQDDLAQRHGRTFDLENATYGKEYCHNLDFFTDFEADFLNMVYNNASAPNKNVLPKPTVSIYNAIKTDFDFSISFSYSDDEDYTFICNKDSFSYKLILVDDLKSEPVNNHVEINTELRSENVVRFILALGLHTAKEMVEDSFEAYWLGSTRVIPDKGDLRDYWTEILSDMDFLGATPSYIYIKDPVRRLCHSLISYSISGRGQAPKKYLFRHAKGRKSGARMSRGYFIGRLADHFSLASDEGLMGLFVASGPERQPDAAANASKISKGGLAVDVGL
ncbi:hypothetical protein Tco_1270979, partial [Tanacetum coccineum]